MKFMNIASRVVGRSGLMVKKFSPQILLGVGIVGVIGSTIMACKATLKIEEILGEAEVTLDAIKDTAENLPDKYSEKDAQKDTLTVHVQTGWKFIKLYAPAVTLGALSIVCIFGSHNIMNKRNIAIGAAYKAIEESYAKYRQRVMEDVGQDKGKEYMYGIKKHKVEAVKTNDDGTEETITAEVTTINPDQHSIYSRFFDESCTQWTKDPIYNRTFLTAQERFANDLLHTRGHVFLNEVYDSLGIKHSTEGAVVGWVKKGDGDSYIDFGIFDGSKKPNRAFVNGYERTILLDFNVDGVIYDLI